MVNSEVDSVVDSEVDSVVDSEVDSVMDSVVDSVLDLGLELFHFIAVSRICLAPRRQSPDPFMEASDCVFVLLFH